MGMAAASSQFCFFFTLLSVFTISSYSRANGAVLLPTHQIRVLVWDFRVLSSVTGSGVPVDLYLNESLVENLVHSEDTSVISWLETHVVTFLPHVDIKTIILGSSGINDGVKSTGENISSEIRFRLEKFQYAMEKINLERRIRLSVAFPLPLLEKMKTTSQERDFHRILDFIKKTDSSVVVESGIENLKLVQSLVEKSEFADIEIRKVSFREDSKQGNLPSSGRKLLYDLKLKTTLHDTTVLPTDPNSPTTPTIVTVPSTNPITVAPTNPTTPTTPIPIPESTPVNMPPPANPPPVTVPGAQPVTNPVTTYPPPAGGNVPGVNPQAPPTPPSTGGNVPGVNPQAPRTPPSNNNAPGGGGSWCVAKPGASQTALQSALDYACGGGADCSTIQQGGSCYNPNTLQNHASYAFNSYYQKNPVPTSCDFGGAATLVHNNPSTGSCVFPSSSSSSSSTTSPTTPASPTATPTTPTLTPPTTTTPPTKQTPPTNPTTTPTTPMTPTTNPITSPAPGGSGSVTPPTVLNSSNPSSVFGTGMPPSVSTSTSRSSVLEPFVGFITLVTSVLAGMIILNM